MSKDRIIPVTEVNGNTESKKTVGIFTEIKDYIDHNLEFTRSDPGIWQPYNAVTGKSFNGTARMRLATANCEDPRWMTEKQAAKVGGTLLPDAEGHRLYFYEKGKTPDDLKLCIYTVYNAKDFEGLPPLEVQSPEKLRGILHATAEANGLQFGKGASNDDLAKMIAHSADRKLFGEDRNGPSDHLRRAIATEFIKSEHGMKVDTLAIKDQWNEVSPNSKAILQTLNDAAKVSSTAMELAPRDMRIEKQVLPQVEQEHTMSM